MYIETGAYIVNRETGERTRVRVVKKTASYAVVSRDEIIESPLFRGGRKTFSHESGWSRRANGKWLPVSSTRKSEQTHELKFGI